MIPPARTGREITRSHAVTLTDQTNRGIRSRRIAPGRILPAVVIKFIAPRIDDTPARCRETIARSTEGPAWV